MISCNYVFIKTFSATTVTETDSMGRSDQPAESGILTGTALENSITELMSLGYSREQVLRALNSSFHNPDRAAEYLLSVSEAIFCTFILLQYSVIYILYLYIVYYFLKVKLWLLSTQPSSL